MLKYSDIYDIWEPITIVIFNESLQTCAYMYLLPVGQVKAGQCTDTWQIFGPTIIEPIHRDILIKILFLTISVQKCILNLKQNNIYL